MRDPGPAEAEYDGDNPHAYRERIARGLYECYRRLRDLGGLVRSRDELLGILERLDAEDMTEEATRLGTATTSLFGEIYRELAEDNPPAAAGGDRWSERAWRRRIKRGSNRQLFDPGRNTTLPPPSGILRHAVVGNAARRGRS